MLIGLLGMLVIAFAVARMSVLERNIQRPSFTEPARKTFVGTGA
jgi:hypothetical protein